MYRLVFCAAAAHTLKYRSCFAYRRASGTPPPTRLEGIFWSNGGAMWVSPPTEVGRGFPVKCGGAHGPRPTIFGRKNSVGRATQGPPLKEHCVPTFHIVSGSGAGAETILHLSKAPCITLPTVWHAPQRPERYRARKGFQNLGFGSVFLHTFCRFWQKVCRRRQSRNKSRRIPLSGILLLSRQSIRPSSSSAVSPRRRTASALPSSR